MGKLTKHFTDSVYKQNKNILCSEKRRRSDKFIILCVYNTVKVYDNNDFYIEETKENVLTQKY